MATKRIDVLRRVREWLFVGLCTALLTTTIGRADDATAADTAGPSLDERLAAIDEQLERYRAEMHAPGLSVAIVKDDEVIFARGYGSRNLDADLPADEHTIYAVGSTTKAFTTALIAMCVDDGVMQWDDHVRTYIEEFHLADDTADANMAVRDLLCHDSGLMRTDLMWYAGDSDWDDIIGAVARAEPVGDYGKDFNYSNPMFLIAGEASARAAQTDWGTLLRTRLFEPLGMHTATITVEAAQQSDTLALGYRWDEDADAFIHMPMRSLDNIAPAGAINASVLDMARWVRLLLARGTFDGQRLISDAQFDEMWKPHIEVQPGVQYGLGWMLRDYHGDQLVEHSGGIDGFTAQVAMIPAKHLGVVVLSNANGSSLPTLAYNVCLDHLLRDAVEEAPYDLVDLRKYEGTYPIPLLDADLTVLVRNGRLALDVPGQMLFDLNWPDDEGKWAFAVAPTMIQVSFNMTEDGESVASLNLYQSGMTFEAFREGADIPDEITPAEAAAMLGRYAWEDAGHEMQVLIQRGRLAVDVPGQMVYELRLPDEQGRWYFRATPEIYVEFERNENGAVTAMLMTQAGVTTPMPRLEDGDVTVLPTPDEIMQIVHEKRGAEAYRQLRNLQMSGTIDFVNQGITGTFTVTVVGFEKYRYSIDLGVFGWIDVAVDGGRSVGATNLGAYEVHDDKERRQALADHPMLLLDDWDNWFTQVDVMSIEDTDDATLATLKFQVEDLPDVEMVIDLDTGELRESRGGLDVDTIGTIPLSVEVMDYHDVAGCILAHRWIIEQMATGKVVLEVADVNTDLDLPADFFTLAEDYTPR
jgi:CubicO group peptidase (beta-lactamase class C family)